MPRKIRIEYPGAIYHATVSIRWIAGRLSMGSWKSLTSRLQEWRKA
jgi:hypothetical protein